MKRFVIYVHGRGGTVSEAEHYKPLFPDSDVIGFDYKSETPWEAREEFPELYEKYSGGYDDVTLIANSIGAFFSMSALSGKKIARAFFISPVVDMEKLITDMMKRSDISENELRSRREITTEHGEILSWDYLNYVRTHPDKWEIPTCILYGSNDVLTSFETVSGFAAGIGAQLTVMEGGEHWFHTEEQMKFLDDWIKKIYFSISGGAK